MKNILFITLPFKSHYFPAFNLANTYRNNGYNIYFTGSNHSEYIVKNEGFNFVTINYLIETEIKDFKNFFGFFLKTLTDKTFRYVNYKEFLRVKEDIFTILTKLNPVKIFLEINIAEYFLFFRNFNIETELFSIYLPTKRRIGIPPLNSNFVPSSTLYSDFVCEYLWIQYKIKRYINNIPNRIAFWNCNDDYYFKRFCKKNNLEFESILNSNYFHSRGVDSLKNNILCSQNLEFSTFKANSNEIFHKNINVRKEFTIQSAENQDLINILKEKKTQGFKIILMSFGTFAYGNPQVDRFIENVIAVIGEMQNVYLLISHIGNFKQLNNEKIRTYKWLPQLQVLEYANLMITHGGLGTYKECVETRVKMLIAPINLALDQIGNSTRVQKNGFGLSIKLNSCQYKIKSMIINSLML